MIVRVPGETGRENRGASLRRNEGGIEAPAGYHAFRSLIHSLLA